MTDENTQTFDVLAVEQVTGRAGYQDTHDVLVVDHRYDCDTSIIIIIITITIIISSI